MNFLQLLAARTHALDDERILEIIKNIRNLYNQHIAINVEFNENITEPELDQLSELHFPPCMRNIHSHFREKHHMRYFMRMQYGLFTKTIGLPYTETHQFWKSEFTKLISEEEFDKKYSYLIKHQHGMVGRCIEYNSYNCETIVEQSPSGLDNHGCPFAHFTKNDINEMLRNDHLKTRGSFYRK